MNTAVLDMPNSRTQRSIEAFKNRFGRPHFVLACHAALPLSFTPELLYGLWANFQQDCQGGMLDIPWIAASDLLLSEFCDEVGHQLYEMDRFIRNELVRQLREDPAFGARRVEAIAQFVSSYVDEQAKSDDPDIRDFAQAQQWTALAYTQSEVAAKQLALALSHAYQHDRDDLLRLALIVEALEDPLADFPQLLAYARGMAHLARGDIEAAKAEFEKMDLSNRRLGTAGVTLAIPLKTERATKPIKRKPIKLRMPRHYWLIASALSVMAWVGSIAGAVEPEPSTKASIPWGWAANTDPKPLSLPPNHQTSALEDDDKAPPADNENNQNPGENIPLNADKAGSPSELTVTQNGESGTATVVKPSEDGKIHNSGGSQAEAEEGEPINEPNEETGGNGEGVEQPQEPGDNNIAEGNAGQIDDNGSFVGEGAGGQTTPDPDITDASEPEDPDESDPPDESETPTLTRITSIDQLVDVSPGDYYFSSLQVLIEYGLQLVDSETPERFRGYERITPDEYESWQKEILALVNRIRRQQGLSPWAFSDFQELFEDIVTYYFAVSTANYDYDHIGAVDYAEKTDFDDSGDPIISATGDPISPMGAPSRWPNGSRAVVVFHLERLLIYLIDSCSDGAIICDDISSPEFINPFDPPPIDCTRFWDEIVTIPPGCRDWREPHGVDSL